MSLISQFERRGRLEEVSITNNLRWVATGVHLLASVVIAGMVWLCVKLLFFPGDLAQLSGGQELFWLIVSVDVGIGPLLTAVVFNVKKSRRRLQFNLGTIAALQLIALLYGLHILYIARPVAIVFEVDRFRLITAAAVLTRELPSALPQFRALPLTGPWILGARRTESAGDERLQAIELALEGFDLGQRPKYWQPYALSRTAALEKSRPVLSLIDRFPHSRSLIEPRLKKFGLHVETARFLPLMARAPDWVVLLTPSGEVAGFAPGDGFF